MSKEHAGVRPLPRGRHRLTREQVAESQRRRIFRAMAETMAEHGYAGTSIAAVLRVAGVSRETFYEQFSSKEDCFMAAFEAALEEVLGSALRAGAAPRDDFAGLLRRYLDALAAQPELARMFLLEVYAAGPEALRRRAALQRRWAAAIQAALGSPGEDDRLAAEAFVVAIAGMATTRLVEGDLAGLRALHGPLLRLADRLFRRSATA